MADAPDGSDSNPNDDEDAIVIWQDVLDEVMAGRTNEIGCPFCKGGTLLVERGSLTGRLRVSCPACGKFIEGALPASDFE